MMAQEHEGSSVILYMMPGSYFSQVALLALHEKHVKYTPRFVDMLGLEYLEPWFLKLNPKAEIPILQHGDRTVPGTELIFPYLDDHFSQEDSTKFLPPKDSESREKVEKYDQLLRTVRNDVLTFGVCFFPELVPDLKMQEYERKMRTKALENLGRALDRFEERMPEAKEIIRLKREQSLYPLVINKNNVKNQITRLDEILEHIEKELASHSSEQQDWWLCCELFTTADIILTVLLNRITDLGLSRLFEPTEKPNLHRYKDRLERRPGFQAFLADVQKRHEEAKALFSK